MFTSGFFYLKELNMMRKMRILFYGLLVLAVNAFAQEVDSTKHKGLILLDTKAPFPVLYSKGEEAHAQKQAALVAEAYTFLADIMGPKKANFLLVVSESDWSTNAYFPLQGMPEYYKGNLIVGAGQNSMADGYEQMVGGFPTEMTTELKKVYTNGDGEFDMQLFFDKLSIHELTHSFQDPQNSEGFSMSRWLEEIHANMGFYAFYKTQRPEELKYVMTLVDFSLNNPSPNLQYSSLADFNTHYYELSPGDYGFYQMKFTKVAKQIIDKLGNEILKPLNDFLIKYDEAWAETLDETAFKERLTEEVDPYIVEVLETW